MTAPRIGADGGEGWQATTSLATLIEHCQIQRGHGMKAWMMGMGVMVWTIACGWLGYPAIAHAAMPTAATAAIHHPVSTQDPVAQSLFDQGLASFFAFDLETAASTFQQAAEQDPALAMAYWGMALASSPDINQAIDPAQEKIAYDAAQQALRLAATVPTPASEQAYIAALAERYSLDPNADLLRQMQRYSDRLAALMQQYPEDPDLATLYAECLMDLQGWELWSSTQAPLGKAPEIVAVLEAVLAKYPDHLGANHYYVHAIAGSSQAALAPPHVQKLAPFADISTHLREVIDQWTAEG